MTILEIRKLLDATLQGRVHQGTVVSGLSLHSREIRPGGCFLAVRGTQQDGADFVDDACRRGAIAVVSEVPVVVPSGVALLLVPDCRQATARLAHAFFGAPSQSLRVVGITGTNGKTTTATLLKGVFMAHGEPAGMVGTIAYEIGDRTIASTRTTPDAVTLQHLLHDMVKAGCRAAVLEVSSHALDQQRTACIDFAAAAFTNLTRDHLDYHHSMDAYYEAKARLLRGLGPERTGVINVDDAWGERLARESLTCGVLTTGITNDAAVRARVLAQGLDGTRFEVESPWGRHGICLQLPGIYNVHNALVCFALACALGIPAGTVATALGSIPSVRGRLQPVPTKAPFRVFVDYAHTDDALRRVLCELRAYTEGQLWAVFGCGGGRDREKRALMGAAVYENADRAVLTSDNPRNEDPEAILAAVRSAFPPEADIQVEVDRRAAIRFALSKAQAGDTICIAGKGHESYQEFEGRMLPFDDALVAGEILTELGYGAL
jgi:UDP-N-acetylmuramoyl-L-alanyl-D-glutamate--2,6-diaminopimelate ligase